MKRSIEDKVSDFLVGDLWKGISADFGAGILNKAIYDVVGRLNIIIWHNIGIRIKMQSARDIEKREKNEVYQR